MLHRIKQESEVKESVTYLSIQEGTFCEKQKLTCFLVVLPLHEFQFHCCCVEVQLAGRDRQQINGGGYSGTLVPQYSGTPGESIVQT